MAVAVTSSLAAAKRRHALPSDAAFCRARSEPEPMSSQIAHSTPDTASTCVTAAAPARRQSSTSAAAALTAHGFTSEEVDQRLAQMSSQDLHQLSQNLEQLQPAGLTRQEWIWIGIGALAALILVVALAD